MIYAIDFDGTECPECGWYAQEYAYPELYDTDDDYAVDEEEDDEEI
jgi:hypothetical protein